MIFVDTHTHLYLTDFENDIDSVIDNAVKNGVTQMLLPAINRSENDNLLRLESRYPQHCKAMMGLHPCSVNDKVDEALAFVKTWLNKQPFYAVGEIGLDYYWDTTYASQQQYAFTTQMQWALEKNLPISIHTRNATEEAIALVEPFAKKGLTGVFHCFGGSVQTAEKIISLGFKLGIGGVVTYKKAGLEEVLQQIDLQHLVLETDAPYLTPVPYRGKRNESAYIKIIAEKIATIKNVSLQEVADITTQNAIAVFKL